VTTEYARALETAHHPPVGVPLWSENFAWTMFDRDTSIGALLHLGRSAEGNPGWRSTVIVYLPDSRLVVTQSTSPGPEGRLGTEALDLDCLDPLQHWRLSFAGMCQATSRAELSRIRSPRGETVTVEIDLTFTALTPIWDVGAMMSLGETHYEQHGRYSGTIQVGGEIWPIDTSGYRDHSTGVRDFAGLGGHVWTHAFFPSGRAFCAFRALTSDGRTGLNEAVIFIGGEHTNAIPTALPESVDLDDPAERLRINLKDQTPITAKILHAAALSLDEPNDLSLGFDAAAGGKVMVDSPATFEWDGEIGLGWVERSGILPAGDL
jgi:hypothetical protein